MVEAAQSVVQLQQAILNLIINAIEAMSGIPRGTAELLIRTESDAAGALCLVGEVLDQKGCAVRPSMLQNGAKRIDPFARFQNIRICTCTHSLSLSRGSPGLARNHFESLFLDTDGRFGRATQLRGDDINIPDGGEHNAVNVVSNGRADIAFAHVFSD
jgi:hypothetical protein